MLNAIARQFRDTLLRQIPNNLDHPKMNIREWVFATFTRYLEMDLQWQNAFVQLLDECIAHVQGAFPFNPKLDLSKDGEHQWIRQCGPEEAQHIRHKILYEFMRADLLFFDETQAIHFADLEPYRILKQVIDAYDKRIEEGIDSRFFARIDMEPHEHDDGYDLTIVALDKEISRQQLYAGKLTTRFMKVLFENEGREMAFGEIYRLMKASKKGERRIPQWIDDLGFNEPALKGVFFKVTGDVLIFRSACFDRPKI